MRICSQFITFESKGIAKLIRAATGRREFRLKTPQGSIMEKLVLDVLGARRAAWRVHYDIVKGRVRTRRKLKIGDATTPIMVVRQRWHDAVGVIQKGGDPVGEIAAQRLIDADRSEMTFGKLVGEFLAVKEQDGMRSVGEVRRILTKDCLPTLAKRPVADVHELEIEAIVERIIQRGSPVSARAVHVHLQSVFSWALGTARWRAAGLKNNPTSLIKKAKPPSPKTRKLSDDELRQFWAALNRKEGMEPATADAFKLILLLARRSKEVLQLPWSELELDRADPLWRLPAHRSKNKRDVLIPLSDAAITILRKRQADNNALTDPHAFVFPGFGAKSMTEGVLRKVLRRISATGQFKSSFSVHDMRRTVAHRCSEELDYSQEIISAFLGHVANHVTDVHYSQATKIGRTRRLAETWAAHLMKIVDGKAESNVVPLRAHG
jgi:integrase